jgi:hypothetical protein
MKSGYSISMDGKRRALHKFGASDSVFDSIHVWHGPFLFITGAIPAIVLDLMRIIGMHRVG